MWLWLSEAAQITHNGLHVTQTEITPDAGVVHQDLVGPSKLRAIPSLPWHMLLGRECAMPVADETLSQTVHHSLLVIIDPHSKHALCKGVLPCLPR